MRDGVTTTAAVRDRVTAAAAEATRARNTAAAESQNQSRDWECLHALG
jgi:hypothetical protein